MVYADVLMLAIISLQHKLLMRNKMSNKVIKLCIPQEVKVRKFDIDKNNLSSLLRGRKRNQH